MLFLYNSAGDITQIINDPVHADYPETLKKQGIAFVEFTNPQSNPRGFKVVDGAIVPKTAEEMKPSAAEIRAERLIRINEDRAKAAPLPVHSMKLAIALSGNLKLLEDEAKTRGISPQDLADKIISKAGETMRGEVSALSDLIDLGSK